MVDIDIMGIGLTGPVLQIQKTFEAPGDFFG